MEAMTREPRTRPLAGPSAAKTAPLASAASIGYLDGVAATEPARAYKAGLLAALGLLPGHRVLDVGCGPATDLPALADAVGTQGEVVGVDRDPAMVAAARERCAGSPNIRVLEGDAERLPLDPASVDRARADRVLMHVADPAAALAELHRVVRPGGLLTLAEPDWDTLAVDHPDLAIARAFTGYVAARANRNPAVGRRLPRLAAAAGFALRAVRNEAVVLTDFVAAETILGIRRVTQRAVAAGAFDQRAAESWLEYLTTCEVFFATVSFITVVAEA